MTTYTRNSRKWTTILSADSHLMVHNPFNLNPRFLKQPMSNWFHPLTAIIKVRSDWYVDYNTSRDNFWTVFNWQTSWALMNGWTPHKRDELDEWHSGLQVQFKYANKISFIRYLNPNQWKFDWTTMMHAISPYHVTRRLWMTNSSSWCFNIWPAKAVWLYQYDPIRNCHFVQPEAQSWRLDVYRFLLRFSHCSKSCSF